MLSDLARCENVATAELHAIAANLKPSDGFAVRADLPCYLPHPRTASNRGKEFVMHTVDDPDQLLENAAHLATIIYAKDILAKSDALRSDGDDGSVPKLTDTMLDAKTELRKPPAKAAICASLKSGTDDLKEITKIAGAALLPLALTGVITLPLTPVAFAAVGLLLFRMGAATYCADVAHFADK